MTAIWMGYIEGRLTVTGSRQVEANLSSWLTLSKFAKVDKIVA